MRRGDVTRAIFLAAGWGLVAVCAQAREIVLSGEQIRARGGTDAELIGEGITLTDRGVIVSVQCDGDGFWIEGPDGKRVFRTEAAALNVPLPRGAYKAFPNLKPGQARATVSIDIRPAGGAPEADLSGSWTGTFRNTLGDSGRTSMQLRVAGSQASGSLDGESFGDAKWDGSAWRWSYFSPSTKATYTCVLRLVGENRARLDYEASGARRWTGVAEYTRAAGGTGAASVEAVDGNLARLAGRWSGTYRNSLGDSGATSLLVRTVGTQASGEIDGEAFQGARWDGSVLRWSYVSPSTKATYSCELRLVAENRARMDYRASGARSYTGVIEYSR